MVSISILMPRYATTCFAFTLFCTTSWTSGESSKVCSSFFLENKIHACFFFCLNMPQWSDQNSIILTTENEGNWCAQWSSGLIFSNFWRLKADQNNSTIFLLAWSWQPKKQNNHQIVWKKVISIPFPSSAFSYNAVTRNKDILKLTETLLKTCVCMNIRVLESDLGGWLCMKNQGS